MRNKSYISFKNINHIPHFYIIRTVEAKLVTDYIVEKTKGSFLDLGCGDGTFCKSLGIRDVYGIDIDENAVNEAVKRDVYKEVLLTYASKIPYPDAYFSTVFSNCAVEHMDELDTVLKEVNRALKDKGEFIFTVPCSQFLKVIRKDKVLKNIGFTNDAIIDEYNKLHHHINILSLEEWKEKLERARFKLVKYEYYLPEAIGDFVARMDMLYTIKTSVSQNLIKELENKYRSLRSYMFRKKVESYIQNPHTGELGTHLIIRTAKA